MDCNSPCRDDLVSGNENFNFYIRQKI
jgi:hypothetical protein